MKYWIKLLAILVGLFLMYKLIYLICVYKDDVFSWKARINLKGKIVYSIAGQKIKVVDVSSGKKKTIYTVPDNILRNLGFATYPSFSPQGGSVVFSQSSHFLDDKLYIMDSDGNNVRPLIDLPNFAMVCPSWSPDGRKIAFLVTTLPWQGLYTVDLYNNNTITQITSLNPYGGQSAWFPNNKLLVFISGEIMRRHLGNRYLDTIEGGAYVVDTETKKIKNYIEEASDVTVSPDGKYLVYFKFDGYYIVDLAKDGSLENASVLMPYKKPFFGKDKVSPVRFSPDGKYVAFCKEVWPGLAGIYVCPIDNPKKQIRITVDDQAIIGMSWAK